MATQDDELTLQALFKIYYQPGKVWNLVYKNNPLYALIPKDEDYTGYLSAEPVTTGVSQNRSFTFSYSNQFLTTDIAQQFQVSVVTNYAQAAISNKSMLLSRNNEGAFVRESTYSMDNALLSLTRSLCAQMYRAGTGSVAQISAAATINSSTVPVQLSSLGDATNIELGMNLAFSATDGGSLRAYASTYAFVVSIDATNATFLCSSTFQGAAVALTSLITSVAVGDYIYQSPGDLNVVFPGLTGWLPGNTATSTLFYGVNRTQNYTRLAGNLIDARSMSLEEGLQFAAMIIQTMGGIADYCFMNPRDFFNLSVSLGSQRQFTQYTRETVNVPHASLGFSAIQITCGSGVVNVISDLNCPQGKAFMLQLDTWHLRSVGPAVRLFNGDSLTFLRDPNADNLNIRCFSYPAMSCRALSYNAQILLPTS